MAAPNIVNVATITAKTVGAALGTNTNTSILNNSASSNKAFKVNTILVSNVDGTNSATVTCVHNDGSNSRHIAKGITVPAGATIVLIDKNSFLYLEENHSIRGGASAASDLEILICYEAVSYTHLTLPTSDLV